MASAQSERGFTLIELSIVLVIIALIVGGILSGQDMIAAAGARSQITQIDQYKAAVNIFNVKYGGLPGDLSASKAAKFGFTARGMYAGEGDGNGLIEGVGSNASASNWGFFTGTGEPAAFWMDLSQAGLIGGTFTVGSETNQPGSTVYYLGGLEGYFPSAKLSPDLFVTIYSLNGRNYFNISHPYEIQVGGCNSCLGSQPTVQVVQASHIDQKIDDGLPQSGAVTAQYNNFGPAWAGPSDSIATAASPTTCYDNNGTAGQQHYSLGQNGGAGPNCALSFRF